MVLGKQYYGDKEITQEEIQKVIASSTVIASVARKVRKGIRV